MRDGAQTRTACTSNPKFGMAGSPERTFQEFAHLLLSIRRRPAAPLAQRPLRLVIFLLDRLILRLTRHALRDEIPGAVALHDSWEAILRRGRYAVRPL